MAERERGETETHGRSSQNKHCMLEKYAYAKYKGDLLACDAGSKRTESFGDFFA